MHITPIKDARHVDSYLVGPLLAVVFTDCVTDDATTIDHVLYVYQPDPQTPPSPGNPPPRVMMISAGQADDGAYHITVTDPLSDADDEHITTTDDWQDLDIFTAKALEIVGERFDINRAPILLPMPDHP